VRTDLFQDANAPSAESAQAGGGLLQRFKPYPAYRDSGVEWLGKIPAHWDVSRISEVTALINGYPFDSEQFVREEGIPLVRIRDLNATETDVNYIGPVVESAWIETGDVIIGMDGDFNVGRWRGRRALLNQRMCCLRPRNGTDAGFIAYALPLPLQVINDLTYSTTVKHLASSDVRKIRVGKPPQPEQQVIARFLDRETTRLDVLVARKEQLIELVEEKRAALIRHAVAKGLNSKARLATTRSPLFPEISVSWQLRKLRRLIRPVRRPVVVDPEGLYREIGIRSWGKGIFHKDPVTGALLEDKSVFHVEPSDLVFNIVFAWEGAVAVVSEREVGMVASHRFPTFRRSEEVDLDYLLMVFQSEQGRALMRINSPGAAGRNRTIRINQFLDEEVPLPPLAEQREIVAGFRAAEQRLQTLLGKVRTAIDQLKEFRTALISAAVTGKIDVRDEAA
jgi:type I restriction enzyme S subunit